MICMCNTCIYVICTITCVCIYIYMYIYIYIYICDMRNKCVSYAHLFERGTTLQSHGCPFGAPHPGQLGRVRLQVSQAPLIPRRRGHSPRTCLAQWSLPLWSVSVLFVVCYSFVYNIIILKQIHVAHLSVLFVYYLSVRLIVTSKHHRRVHNYDVIIVTTMISIGVVRCVLRA